MYKLQWLVYTQSTRVEVREAGWFGHSDASASLPPVGGMPTHPTLHTRRFGWRVPAS
jgi:hypothetical protein